MNVSSSTSMNPALAAMLSQLTPSTSASTTPSALPPASGSDTSSAASVGTGSGKAQVSDAIMDMFSKMHQATGSAHSSGGAGGAGGSSGSTTTASTASTMIDPLDQLMAAINMDEDEPAGDTEPDLSMFYSSNNASAS
jgi:hypothetical protein